MEISYFEIISPESPLSEVDLNPTDSDGRLFTRGFDCHVLGKVADARLITPTVSTLSHFENSSAAEKLLMLMGTQTRITYHHGLAATWDKDVDAKAWSTNIDTVYFVDWLRSSGALNLNVKVSAEIGCGIGGISQALLSECRNLERHVFTDIDANAINATRRNLKPLEAGREVTWFIGKGLDGLAQKGPYDIIVTNPPYIPHPDNNGDVDHYSGTKLIRRLFEDGIALLNRDNPDAAIYMQMSSLTERDFIRYRNEFPDIQVTPLSAPVRVPLRILGLLREPHVMEYLERECGLERVVGDSLEYYHRIMAFKLTRRQSD